MTKIYLSYNNIICPLGFNSPSVISKIEEGSSSIQVHSDPRFLNKKFCASLINDQKINSAFSILSKSPDFTKLEKMMLLSLSDVIDQSKSHIDKKTGLIISTTKGNIDALEATNPFSKDRAYLGNLGDTIRNYFDFKNEAIVLSNACVSGLLAISVAKRLIEQNLYDKVFIVSGDIISKFVLSGFDSFQAMSNNPCKPYSNNRDGINIGEAAASCLVTKNENDLAPEAVEILGSSNSNDANHISGPSRTGEGLFRAMDKAISESNLADLKIDFISAHGTATVFNDEMEAVAINRLGLQDIPLNSLKGVFGHTMGASGLLETIVGMHSLNKNLLFPSKGFDELGVSKPLNIIKSLTPNKLNVFLKTASGFGGCNSAVLFKKMM